LADTRLDSLYDAEGFGGDKTMRAKVIRELIDEIRDLRRHVEAHRQVDPAATPVGRGMLHGDQAVER
jgi:hypothetical protein